MPHVAPPRYTPELRESARLRRNEIKDFIQHAGFWSLPIKQLAEKYRVDVATIYRDIEYIRKTWPVTGVKDSFINLNLMLQEALRKCMHILTTETDNLVKLNAVRTLAKAEKAYVELLEAYGLKPTQAREFLITTVNIEERVLDPHTIAIIEAARLAREERKQIEVIVSNPQQEQPMTTGNPANAPEQQSPPINP